MNYLGIFNIFAILGLSIMITLIEIKLERRIKRTEEKIRKMEDIRTRDK